MIVNVPMTMTTKASLVEGLEAMREVMRGETPEEERPVSQRIAEAALDHNGIERKLMCAMCAFFMHFLAETTARMAGGDAVHAENSGVLMAAGDRFRARAYEAGKPLTAEQAWKMALASMPMCASKERVTMEQAFAAYNEICGTNYTP